MGHLGKGLVAGFVGTAVLSAIMIVKSMMGLMPQVDAIGMLSNMIEQRMGVDNGTMHAWVAHFLIGTVLWGGLTGILYGSVSKSPLATAMIVAVGAWILMMVIVMPMAGAGMFGLNIGPQAPIATLVLHIVFGAVMGLVFSGLVNRPKA